MKREFVINAALLLVSNLLIKVYFLLGVDRPFQLVLGAEQYGLYYSLFNLTLLFQFINDFGLQNFTNRYISQNRDDSQQRFQDFTALKVILSLIYLGFILLVCILGNYNKPLWPLILHLAANQVVVSAIFFNRSAISGMGFYRQDSFFSVLDRFLLVLMGTAVLWVPAFQKLLTVDGFVWMQSLSLLITWILSLFFLKKKGLNLQWNWAGVSRYKRLLVSTLPFVGIYLFSTLYNKMDTVLLHRLHPEGAHQAGVYAASMRLFEAASMISLAVGGLLLAMFSRLYKQQEKLSSLFQLSIKWLFVGTMLVSCIGYFYAEIWIKILYHTDELIWIQAFQLVMIAFLPASLNFIMGAFYQAIHREVNLMVYYALASLISIIGNIYFIPEFGVLASALIAMTVHGMLFIIQAIMVWRDKLVIISKDFVIFSILFFLLSVFFSTGIYFLEVDWKFKVILTAASITGVAFLFRMISLVEMREQNPNA
ncbi:MAG: oligosaccharide flippase family protein [Saprospiraceae bacterium]|nr:oligosaccharide flippase family protein [Saprospiraceae bacterium]